MSYEDGQKVTMFGFTVQGDSQDAKQRLVKNPRIFEYEDSKTKAKAKAISIKVKQIMGFGETLYLEVCCFGDAFKDAKALKLKAGDQIDFHGRYQIVKGKKLDFHKVNLNDSQQIRIFSGRKAKVNEL